METPFKKQFSGLIRSLKTSEDNRFLCVEQLDTKKPVPRYHVIDIKKCVFIEEELIIKNSNTIILKAITNNSLILNEYSDGQNPDKATAIAFNFKEHKIKWQKENFQVLEVGNNRIKSPHQHFENRCSFWDIDTGLIIEPNAQSNAQTNKTGYFPLIYPETNQHFGWFVKFIKEKNGHQAILCCEYLEMARAIVISYYFKESDGLTNNLLILATDGKIKESIKLGENLKGIGKDTFFALDNRLVFITNKNTLNIYEI